MAYITKEQAQKARKIVNRIGKEYGFKFSTRKRFHTTLEISLISGRRFTLNDFKIESSLKAFIKKYGLEKGEYDRTKTKLIKEFLSGASNYTYNCLYDDYYHISKAILDGLEVNVMLFCKDGEIGKMFQQIEKEVKEALGWYDNSDLMTDLIDTAFYIFFKVSKNGHKYKIIENNEGVQNANSANARNQKS